MERLYLDELVKHCFGTAVSLFVYKHIGAVEVNLDRTEDDVNASCVQIVWLNNGWRRVLTVPRAYYLQLDLPL